MRHRLALQSRRLPVERLSHESRPSREDQMTPYDIIRPHRICHDPLNLRVIQRSFIDGAVFGPLIHGQKQEPASVRKENTASHVSVRRENGPRE